MRFEITYENPFTRQRQVTVREADSEREAVQQVVKGLHSSWWLGDKQGDTWPGMEGGRCKVGLRAKVEGTK